MYVVLAVFGSTMAGSWSFLWMLCSSVSAVMVVWVSVMSTWMSSLFVPGSWARMVMVLGSSSMSIRGSVCVSISLISAFVGWWFGFIFPNFFMIGFPSGPVVMEKP